MNQSTPAVLLDAARELFATRGYDGASIRSITRQAGTNLGAVTYHFGSKKALYHRVIETFIGPLRERVRGAARTPGPPLDRIEGIVRASFEYYADNPAMPRLILQQIASGRPPPPPAQRWVREGLGILSELIREGQRDGSIRGGNPLYMSLTVLAPTLFIHLVRGMFRDTIGVDLGDPETRAEVLGQVVRSVRGGLAS